MTKIVRYNLKTVWYADGDACADLDRGCVCVCGGGGGRRFEPLLKNQKK